MEEVVWVGDFAVEQAVTVPAQFSALVAVAPCEQIIAGFERLRLDALQPRLVLRVTEVFADAVQDGAGFELVAAEVLDEAVVALAVEDELDAPLGDFVPAHGIEEENHRGAFGADGRVGADAGHETAPRFLPERVDVEMQKPGADAFVDSLLGELNLRAC